MPIFKKRESINEAADAALVMYSLGGDRDAFCAIVSRYQNLLCSLAYSSVGDIKYSEDIAQEAFVEAWKKLDTLRDPEKLKSWLCGILRFKVSHFRRKEDKQAINDAQVIESEDIHVSSQSKMDELAIQEQEQVLLWKALDGMDSTYREPLVLFYREQQSIERVAIELDLSEDNVKQRLSRGRKLLKRAMSTFVEDALVKSKPGAGFTAGVLAAINLVAPPAKAAALGAGAFKTGSMFKLATLLTLLAVFSGFISGLFGLRASLDQARTERERKQTFKVVGLFFFYALVYVAAMFGLRQLAINDLSNAAVYATLSQVVVLGLIACYVILVIKMLKNMRQLRAQERIFQPQAFLREVDKKDAKQREYKSRTKLFGVPLVHFQFGMPEEGDKSAFGWIAGGAKANGLLFAWGGVAIAPISVGIFAIGAISVGAIGIGLLGTGTVAIGIIAFGSSAIAYKAYASMSALGWESAFSNGFSIAIDAAIAPMAFASEVNSEQAGEIINLVNFEQSYQWVLGGIALLVIVPAVWHARKVRQPMGKNQK